MPESVLQEGAETPTLVLLDGRVKMPLSDLLAYVHSQPDDIVLVSGTLIEGIGNWTSDFDVYVVTERRRDEFPKERHHRHYFTQGKVSGTFDFMDRYSFTVDVYYRELWELERLVEKMREEYRDRRRRTKIMPTRMPDHNVKFAHRLFDALPVQNPDRFRQIFQGVSRDEYCYAAYRQVTCAYPEFRDIVGSWRDGDLDICCYQARTYLRRQMLGFTHLNGNINMNDKWTVKLAKLLPTPYQPLAQRYVALMNRGSESEPEKRRLVRDCLDLADDLFAAARPILDANPAFLPCAEAREITARERAQYTRWHPELSREFAYRSRLFEDGLPPMREFLDPDPGSALARLLADDPFCPAHLRGQPAMA